MQCGELPMTAKPKVAVHKFTSCDGCQLAFLNAGPDLLALAEAVEIVHFVEAGVIDPNAEADIAFVEGSVSTPDEEERIRAIRARTGYLITIGACATAGGVQALRNIAENSADWMPAIYASPEYIRTLPTSTPIAAHVKVDLELWGCPVNTRQVLAAARDLLSSVAPLNPADAVCMECKRRGNVCVMVAKGEACMGPVTRTGCGALCPSFERDCYACYGPSEHVNYTSLSRRFEGLGLLPEHVARRFLFINNAADKFAQAGKAALEKADEPKA
jgi:sulfhydrogenase subunit delta